MSYRVERTAPGGTIKPVRNDEEPRCPFCGCVTKSDGTCAQRCFLSKRADAEREVRQG